MYIYFYIYFYHSPLHGSNDMSKNKKYIQTENIKPTVNEQDLA